MSRGGGDTKAVLDAGTRRRHSPCGRLNGFAVPFPAFAGPAHPVCDAPLCHVPAHPPNPTQCRCSCCCGCAAGVATLCTACRGDREVWEGAQLRQSHPSHRKRFVPQRKTTKSGFCGTPSPLFVVALVRGLARRGGGPFLTEPPNILEPPIDGSVCYWQVSFLTHPDFEYKKTKYGRLKPFWNGVLPTFPQSPGRF